MAIKGDDITISTSPTVIWTATSSASSGTPQSVIVQNNSATVCTVGGSDVANGSNGVKIFVSASGHTDYTSSEDYSSGIDYAGETTLAGDTNIFGPVDLTQPLAKVYAIAASGTPTVSILVSGV